MSDEMAERDRFLEAVAIQSDYWSASISRRLTEADSDLDFLSSRASADIVRTSLVLGGVSGSVVRECLAEILNGLALAILTAMDEGSPTLGGSPLHLADPHERSLGPLHEAYVAHLIDTGRLPLPDLGWTDSPSSP